MLQEIALEHDSTFLRMIEDYAKGDPGSLMFLFEGEEAVAATWNQLKFRKFTKESEKLKQDWRPKAGKTSVTRYLWLAEDGTIRAHGLLRFPLDAKTEIDGGNLVFSVPPSLRGKGFGSYCLALMLFEAVRAGLRRVLVTCPAGDLAARRVVEKNRGVFQDEVGSTHAARKGARVARYWISFS
jgi:predicted acetyltransferase